MDIQWLGGTWLDTCNGRMFDAVTYCAECDGVTDKEHSLSSNDYQQLYHMQLSRIIGVR